MKEGRISSMESQHWGLTQREVSIYTEKQHVGCVLASKMDFEVTGGWQEEMSLRNYSKNQAHKPKGLSNVNKRELLKNYYLFAEQSLKPATLPGTGRLRTLG